MSTEILLDGLCFGEGPRWHDGRLWFSDMHAHKVLALSTDGVVEEIVEVIEEKEVETAMAPIIEYFWSVKDKYSQDKKHPKRLKAAAMYNLAQIYLYLDQPEKTIEIGEEYIRWDHDKKDGKRFVESGKRLKHFLDFHGAKRYFVTDEDADKVVSEDEDSASN